MPIKYTRIDTEDAIKKASDDMKTFYRERAVNRSGKSKAEDGVSEYYTEIVAEWLLRNIMKLKGVQRIPRNSSYFVDSHDGESRKNISNRQEEKTAMEIWTQGTVLPIGHILDYQVPLKDTQNDTAGKIDLLSYDDKKAVFRILELKRPGSKETLLRCVLEAYTYMQIVDKRKLVKEAQKAFPKLEIPNNAELRACPLFFEDSLQWNEFNEMKKGERPNLRELMKKLSIEPIVLSEQNGRYSASILKY